MERLEASHDEVLTIAVLRDERTYRIVLDGELDVSQEAALLAALQRAEGSEAPRILIDLRRLRFMDSTGLLVFLEAQTRASSNGHRLELLRGPRAVQQVFELTGTADRFRFVD
jgi:anti-anti-sigma factor